MSPFKPAKLEWITFLSLMPPLVGVLHYLLFGDKENQPLVFLQAFPVLALILFISWYLHVVSMQWLRIKMPHFNQTILRLSILTVVHLSLITSSMIFYFYGFDAVHFLDYRLNVHNFRLSVLMGITLILLTTSIWEGHYIFKKWKESLAEKELLEQLQLQNEFDSLKSQVNPHFLFNCFNTLSSLISEDTRQAETFLDEMSKVYRYLLRSNEDGLTTLEKELQFISSYFKLLKSRYGNALEFKIEVDKTYETYLLPSLSLQLLVENAVKHNIVSKQMPLVIDIFTTTGNKLIVNNNLQLKLIKASSTGIGLENIRSKYELLEQPGFQVLEDDKNFTVVLPLLWSKTSENNFTLSMGSYN
jgi:sensor histidine kinase YesM